KNASKNVEVTQQNITEISKKQKFLQNNRLYFTLGLCLAVLIIYSQTFYYQFVNLDDSLLTRHADYFKSIQNICIGFVHSYWLEYYRPVLGASFILDSQVVNISADMYHISNVCIHLFVCIVLFFFLQRWGYSQLFSFLGALIFAVHPLFTQAIGWVFGRNDTLLGFFCLLSMCMGLLFFEKKKIVFLFFFAISFFLVLLTKETGVVLPIICIAIPFVHKQISFRERYLEMVVFCIVTICIVIVWWMLRSFALENASTLLHYERFRDVEYGWNVFLHNLPLLSESVAKFFVPISLSTWSTYSVFTTTLGIIVIGLLFLVGYWFQIPWKMVLWLLVWWIIFLLPPMVFINTSLPLSDYLEHRIYVSAIAYIFFILEIITSLEKHANRILFLCICIAIALGTKTFFYVKTFENEKTFWTNATESSPTRADAWGILGCYYYDKDKDYVNAERCLKKSVALNTQDADLFFRLGVILETRESTDSAKMYYKTALAKDSTKLDAAYNIGLLFGKENYYDSSCIYLEKVVRINPKYWEALLGLGIIAYNYHQYQTAELYWKQVLEINPQYTQTYHNLISLYSLLNNTAEVERYSQLLKELEKQ
ncbi:MAG: glycosyltransferase family 39 protein, partial [Chitinophagaceae bacterium]|nr:glycosyltransferase family 39 protein [Chitinophagaceae bacterium]